METRTVSKDQLQFRGDGNVIAYLPNEDTPFTGRAEDFYDNGHKESETNFKDGKENGLTTDWYENGQKMGEENYKDGKLDGLTTRWYENGKNMAKMNFKDGEPDGLATLWDENGKKEGELNYKDGKEDGLSAHWYENGQKEAEGNWKDGKVMSAVGWKPNGEKCPVTSVKNGNGVKLWYILGSTQVIRETYKDGKLVKD